MNDILVFNTLSGNWSLQKASGPTPSARILHTSVLLPNSNLLIYGGSDPDSLLPLKDFCYQLDTVQFLWTQVPLPLNIGAGPRYGHSAVLYKNATMFILFGIDSTGVVTNDFHLFDIERMGWTDTFTTREIQPSEDNEKKDNSGLSQGALAGILISVITTIGIFATAVALFCLRRREKAEKKLYQSRGNGKESQSLVDEERYQSGNSEETDSIRRDQLPESPGFSVLGRSQSPKNFEKTMTEIQGPSSEHQKGWGPSARSSTDHSYYDFRKTAWVQDQGSRRSSDPSSSRNIDVVIKSTTTDSKVLQED
ncbi:hypothetical protein DFQ28_009588 [Apophysomyces sp. BC1034]|nr:hypothetical protein DFQ29_009570 [Apophysomyces sp. BC1021]KAG0192267.1 hypothetical protein DFQ28_009588 [Apophysomyces sp. BC1034]